MRFGQLSFGGGVPYRPILFWFRGYFSDFFQGWCSKMVAPLRMILDTLLLFWSATSWLFRTAKTIRSMLRSKSGKGRKGHAFTMDIGWVKRCLPKKKLYTEADPGEEIKKHGIRTDSFGIYVLWPFLNDRTPPDPLPLKLPVYCLHKQFYCVECLTQWWIQDFSKRGAQTPERCANLSSGNIFAENCVKIK